MVTLYQINSFVSVRLKNHDIFTWDNISANIYVSLDI